MIEIEGFAATAPKYEYPSKKGDMIYHSLQDLFPVKRDGQDDISCWFDLKKL